MCCRGGGRVPWAPLWLQEGAELSLAGFSLGSGSWRGAGCMAELPLGSWQNPGSGSVREPVSSVCPVF